MTVQLSYDMYSAVVRYDPDNGILYWRERPLRKGLERLDKGWNTRFKNKPAGRPDHFGHLYLNLNYKNRAVHRIAWLLYYKEQPPDGIDHINGNPSDNRICNLRKATQSENLANARIRSNNTSGVRGVSWDKKSGVWYAYINKDGKMYALGKSKSFVEACNIRKAGEEKFFGSYARAA